MADWTVDEDTKLGRFLHKQRIQTWRIPILVRCGGVKVFRNGTDLKPEDETVRLKAQDKVRLITPTPPACRKALQAEADTNWRDYAIVPGTTPFDKRMAKVIDARPRTIRIKNPMMHTLAGFIAGLADSDEITNPIRHLMVVSHANTEGRLKIQLESGAADYIEYEDLIEAMKPPKKLVIDMSLLSPRPTDAGAPIPAWFLIWGCLIGRLQPYMKKLKEALGNKITVIAPKHDHIGAELKKPPGGVEYMGYKFQANSPKKLKDKKAVIAAFISAAGPRIDNKPVPNRLWSEWVPNDPNATTKPEEWREFKNKVKLPVFGVNDNAPRKFKYFVRPLFGLGTSSISLPKDPGTDAGYKKALKDYIVRNVVPYADKDFPQYVRLGYKSMDEFMDGWDWHFKYDSKTQKLSFNPERHQYMMIQPITDPATNVLFMNFYPTTKKGKLIELLKATDSRFYSSSLISLSWVFR